MINVIVSGYFNPIHPFHIGYIDSAIELGKSERRWLFEGVKLWIIINSDRQVKMKGSCPFYNESERYRILKKMYPTANVRISKSDNRTVGWDLITIQAIAQTNNLFCKTIFCNGGDVNEVSASCEEMTTCAKEGILIRFGVGGSHKIQSSSSIIKQAVEWHKLQGK